jgi:hypothetical protein
MYWRAYNALAVLFEVSDDEAADLVCGGRTALEFACQRGGDVRALELLWQYRHNFVVSEDVYKQYRKTLGSDARTVLESLYKTSSPKTKKKSWSFRSIAKRPFRAMVVSRPNESTSSRLNDDTSDIDRGLFPAPHHDPPLTNGPSFEGKVSFETQINTRPLQTAFIEPVDSDLKQHQTLPVDGEPTYQVESNEVQTDVQPFQSLPVELVNANGDVPTDSDLLETRNDTFSTDGTLVGAAGRTLESLTFNFHEHRTLPPKDLEHDRSDVASLLSRTDASEAGSSATLVEYQHAATDVIAKAFLGKDDLLRTYSKAIKIVGTDRFIRNNARLLQGFSADLKVEHHLPSETLVVWLLATTSGRRLVSAAICDQLDPNRDPRPQRQLELTEDEKMMLDRFLGEINSAVQPKPAEDTKLSMPPPEDHSVVEEAEIEGALQDSKCDDGVASITSMSDGEVQITIPTDQKMENLEETVHSFMSGRPIQLYQKKLQQWLDLLMQPSRADSRPVDTIGSPEEEASDQSPITEMRSQHIADVFVQDAQDKLPSLINEPTAPNVNADAPPTISQKGGSKSTDNEPKEEVTSLLAEEDGTFPRQMNNSLPSFAVTLLPSLPLLVERVLRYLPLPYVEPPIPEGNIRVRWKSVGCIIC